MKKIAVTQRIDISNHNHERRDCLDQRWMDFLFACNVLPILIPNQLQVANRILNEIKVDGFLLTGGNDLTDLGGAVPERDEVEKSLIKISIEEKIPLVGVCRGMQMVQNYFNVPLEKIKGHVVSDQQIDINGIQTRVNSYHHWGTTKTSNYLKVWASSSDGVVKAIAHTEHAIAGMMWHPERMNPFSHRDIEWFRQFYKI